MGSLQNMKQGVLDTQSAMSRSKVIDMKPPKDGKAGDVMIVRFLRDMDDTLELVGHSAAFEEDRSKPSPKTRSGRYIKKTPCFKWVYDRPCFMDDNERIDTFSMYAVPVMVYNPNHKEDEPAWVQKVMCEKSNPSSPYFYTIAWTELNETLLGIAFQIKRISNTDYTVTEVKKELEPMKIRERDIFTNEDMKRILAEAKCPEVLMEVSTEEDEDEVPARSTKSAKATKTFSEEDMLVADDEEQEVPKVAKSKATKHVEEVVGEEELESVPVFRRGARKAS